jgi:DNA-binding transcriptional LysR family regulator
MDKLRAIEIYVRIVERGSLTAASEALGLSVPTVVRSLASLEKRLGVRLLNRTTRRLHLTEEGREYYEHCKRLLADIATAEAALTEARATPAGRIVVTAPVPFGRWHVAPLIAAFLAKHPQLKDELQ